MKKNPILTENQANVIRRVLPTFEKKLTELNSEIPIVQAEVKGHQTRLKALVTVLEKAKRLRTKAEKAMVSLDDAYSDLSEAELQSSEDTNTFAYSTHRAHSKLDDAEKQLTEIQISYLEVARSALEKASQEIIQAEEDIEVNQYLLFCKEEYFLSLVDLRNGIKNKIDYLQDLTGARRRMPSELWLQVFEERVREDEKAYINGSRHGNPPFSVLQLSGVCQEWRMFVLNRPSLWRFIAIPHVEELSSRQKDRIRHFVKHLGHHSAIAYMGHRDNGTHESDRKLANLLELCTSFKYLELYISSKNSRSESFLKGAQPHIEHLFLFGTIGEDVYAPLTYMGIRNVRNISCSHVRPRIEGDEKPLDLTSLHLTQSKIDNALFVTFIRETSTTTMNLETNSPFKISGLAVDADTALSNLTTLRANLTVLVTLFNDHVSIPNLRSLTIIQEPTMTDVDTLQHWASFITTHQRKDTISTLGMSGSLLVEKSEAPTLYRQMVSQVANVEHLVLEGAAVVPALEGVASVNDIPPKLVEITVSKSDDVTSEHIGTFMENFRTTRRKQLSLRIDECPGLAAKFPELVILNPNILENIGHT
jgi:hypothetical protein